MPKEAIGLPSDESLAEMVKNSAYVQGTSFDPKHAKFLLVFAVPYGPEDDLDLEDGANGLRSALEAAHALFREDDHKERTWEVWNAETGAFMSHVSLEELEFNS